MGPTKTLAILLRKIDYSETSQVVRLYAADAGKISAIAKGSKREKSSFHGPFDLFTIYEIVRLEKGDERLDLIIQAQAVRNFVRLREDVVRYAAASYATELIDEMSPEGQPNEGLYDLLVTTLANLDEDRSPLRAVFSFEARALRILGLFPRLLECGSCRRKIAQLEAYFSPRDGGAICIACSPRDRDYLLVRSRTLYALNALLTADPFVSPVYDEARDEIRRLLDIHLRFVLERDLKSARLMRDLVLR